jgi:hypothetical protein
MPGVLGNSRSILAMHPAQRIPGTVKRVETSDELSAVRSAGAFI